VSGGLDSAIVAACLTAAEIDANCITMFTDDPAGDERDYARLLCDRVGLRLFEQQFAIGAIDVTRPLGGHLPRPIGRAQDQAYEHAHLQLAQEEGANAFFTGNGGDNVFGYSQSAAAIADRVLYEGLTLGVTATIRDVCAHAGCGPLSAVRAAIQIARRRSYRWRSNPTFLDSTLCEALERQCIGHPWLDAPAGALPGKAAHIAALLRVQMNLEPGRSRYAPVVHPLLSQPIVELCLAFQSWEWRSGGRDRALARDAFAGELPRGIVERRTKGSPDQFCSAIISHNRDLIRERLMEGRLAEWRILHRPAIETALRADRMTRGDENVRLLQLVNVEAWLESWSTRVENLRGCPEMPAPGVTRPNSAFPQ
jgi:asparagine synthase (glutamine-hydrolysing)